MEFDIDPQSRAAVIWDCFSRAIFLPTAFAGSKEREILIQQIERELNRSTSTSERALLDAFREYLLSADVTLGEANVSPAR
jgi:hypothetical protein